jgi:AcrR family transcriptional regulator
MLARMARLPEHLKGNSAGEERVPRAVLVHHQRERVLSNVMPVFARRGYQETTVDDLLAAGKVGVGNFYSLFEGKEDCFLAGFAWYLDALRARVESACAGAGTWGEGAVLGIREFVDAFCAEPVAAQIILVEAQASGAEGTRRYEALLDEVAAQLRSGRRRGSGLPGHFEATSVAGLAYYLQQCLLGPEMPEPQVLLGEIAPLVLEPIIGAAELRAQLAAHPLT